MKLQNQITKRNINETIPKTLHAPAGTGGQVSKLAESPEAVPSFKDAGLMSNGRVFNIISNVLGPLMPPAEFQIRTTLADNEYLETTPEFVVSSIVADPVLSVQSYHAEIFDCDDYVLYLKTKLSLYAASNLLSAPLAVGYLFTDNHAFTFCISSGSVLFLINTQSADHAVTGDPATFVEFLSLGPGNRITTIYI